MGMIDEKVLMKEHYQILADVKVIREKLEEGTEDHASILTRLDSLEKQSVANTQALLCNASDHLQFVKSDELKSIEESLNSLKLGTVIMSPQQAKSSGHGWFAILLQNPIYLMWLTFGFVVIILIYNGFTYSEIMGIINQLPK